MNEIFSRGADPDFDWIEIYNSTGSSVDISGYKIYDSGGFNGTKPKKEFPSGSVIPANGFLVIVTDDTTESGFGLSSGGEDVWLEDASNNVIDFVSFPAMDLTQSYNRIPDGSDNWTLSNFITKGLPNTLTDVEENGTIITEFNLQQNYPNPFNPSTTIKFSIPASGFVTLKIYDILGKEVSTLVNENKTSGVHQVSFNAAGLSSGVYFYELKMENFVSVKKLLLTK